MGPIPGRDSVAANTSKAAVLTTAIGLLSGGPFDCPSQAG